MRSVPAVQVCFTMDVERLAEKSPTGGPDNLGDELSGYPGVL